MRPSRGRGEGTAWQAAGPLRAGECLGACVLLISLVIRLGPITLGIDADGIWDEAAKLCFPGYPPLLVNKTIRLTKQGLDYKRAVTQIEEYLGSELE